MASLKRLRLDESVRLWTMSLVSAVALASCGGETSSTEGGDATSSTGGASLCVPGQSVSCACPDGSQGAQTCDTSGDGFGACTCEGASTSGGSGTSDATTAPGTTDGAETSDAGTSDAGTTDADTSGTTTSGDTSSSGGSSTGDPGLVQGAPCMDGDICASGSCVDGFCCDTVCADTCEVCAWDLGASEDGVCTPAPYTSTASEACPGTSTCDGASSACVDACVDTPLTPRPEIPADLVFVVDNSGSMTEEIAAIEATINTNLVNALDSSGVDYQVIMVTEHGSGSLSLCVQPPLSGTANCNGVPVEIPDQFAAYDVNVQSHDALCILLDTLYDANPPDAWGLHPGGWGPVLRPEALKVFIPATDDGTNCTQAGTVYNDLNTPEGGVAVGTSWDQALLALAPSQFGDATERRYVVHSIIGIAASDSPGDGHPPTDPIVTGGCPTSVDIGSGYQALSRGTGGLRFSSCDVNNYGAYFDTIAQDVLARVTEGACTYDLPTPPAGQTLDLTQMRAQLTNPMGALVDFTLVDSVDACADSETSFYVEGGAVQLCPQTCAAMDLYPDPTLTLQAQCE